MMMLLIVSGMSYCPIHIINRVGWSGGIAHFGKNMFSSFRDKTPFPIKYGARKIILGKSFGGGDPAIILIYCFNTDWVLG